LKQNSRKASSEPGEDENVKEKDEKTINKVD
jgi:hypothetical protein